MNTHLRATLATLGSLVVLLAVLACAGVLGAPFATGLAPGLGMLVLARVAGGPQLSQRPQRPQGPGWYWSTIRLQWENGLPFHADTIEDEIDAAVAAWKTVYGEDIGYNEHSVTLEWLGSLHRTNALSSQQLADCCDAVEWITWALKQPDNRKLSRLLDEPSTITTRSDIVREGQRRGRMTLQETLALEIETLQAKRKALTFDPDQYAKAVDRFTSMARPGGYIIEHDKRVDADVFERMREQLRANRMAVLEAGTTIREIEPCERGCRRELVSTNSGPVRELRYCDGSHTRDRQAVIESGEASF